VRSGAPFGQADNARFHAPLMSHHQRAAKGSTFVVGVRRETHHP
jgi:hypothetical protein